MLHAAVLVGHPLQTQASTRLMQKPLCQTSISTTTAVPAQQSQLFGAHATITINILTGKQSVRLQQEFKKVRRMIELQQSGVESGSHVLFVFVYLRNSQLIFILLHIKCKTP